METLTWKIDGAFITRIVREKLWWERQPYSEVEKLLLGCLKTDQLSDEERKDKARQILMGTKKLVGINSFTLEDDNDDTFHSFDLSIDNLLKIIFELKDQAKSLNSRVIELESELEETQNELAETKSVLQEYVKEAQELTEYLSGLAKQRDPIEKLKKHLEHSNMVDIITWNQIFHDVTEDVKKRFVEFCEQYSIIPARSVYGQWEWITFRDKETEKLLEGSDFIRLGIIKDKSNDDTSDTSENPIVEEESGLDEQEVLKYGFLAPSGDFIEGPWGTHEELAFEIIKDKGWEDEYFSWQVETIRHASDFLVQVKGYVLLHCPCGFGRTDITRSQEKRLTKAQREFLYDYLIKDGQDILANHIIQED